MVKDRFTRQLLISGGIIVASIIIAGGALFFFSSSISAQALVIANDRMTIQQDTNTVANLAQLGADASQAMQYQAAIDQLLPSQYGLVTFTQWLTQLGEKYNVTADAAFQGSITPPTGVTPGSAQFSFSAEGTPGDIASFLDDMDAKSAEFLLSLSSFDVSADGTNEKVTGQGVLFFQQ
jgi:hypothetical protein